MQSPFGTSTCIMEANKQMVCTVLKFWNVLQIKEYIKKGKTILISKETRNLVEEESRSFYWREPPQTPLERTRKREHKKAKKYRTKKFNSVR